MFHNNIVSTRASLFILIRAKNWLYKTLFHYTPNVLLYTIYYYKLLICTSIFLNL